MPKEMGDKVAVTVWIDKKVAEKAGELAEKGAITRSKFLSNIIEVGVEEIGWADKVGLWTWARVYADFREKLRKMIKKAMAKAQGEVG